MNFTIVNNGVDEIIRNWLNKLAPGNFTVHLYTNNHTPAVTDTVANYTETTLSGYAAATLAPASWTGSSSAGTATYNYIALTFNFTAYGGGTTIYGVYITFSDGTLCCAGLLDTAFAVPQAGGSLTLNLQATEA